MLDWRDLVGMAGRGLLKGLQGHSPNDVYREERRRIKLGRMAVNEAALAAFLKERQAQYDQKVSAERARGNRGLPQVVLTDGWFEGQRAIVAYNNTGRRGRIDVYYGGGSSNPLQSPDNDYHGHIIVQDNAVIEWLLPGPKYSRRKAI